MNKAAPSTLGTLLSGAVMAVAKEMKGKAELSPKDICRIPGIMANSIREKGKADRGDKTILDALIPMSEVIDEEFRSGSDLKQCFYRGAEAAKKGAENTSGMIPKAGRAQWIGERVKEYRDGGAVLCAVVSDLFHVE
jgi:dihydroxyacetone kinase